VPRRHASVVVSGTVQLVDLGSRNGTFHNGVRIGPGADGPDAVRSGPSVALRPGDLLRCGDTVLAVTGAAGRSPAGSDADQTRTATGLRPAPGLKE
jgi:SARP family transcriptional regulator, regulator of embCAB operon